MVFNIYNTRTTHTYTYVRVNKRLSECKIDFARSNKQLHTSCLEHFVPLFTRCISHTEYIAHTEFDQKIWLSMDATGNATQKYNSHVHAVQCKRE